MVHINECVFLKTKWSDKIHEVFVISFVQKIDSQKNIIELTFRNKSDGKEYLYYWTSTPSQGSACVLYKGKMIDDKELEEIARHLSCWYRSQLSTNIPIETF